LSEARKNSLIIFAGPYATVVPERVVSALGIHAVMRGEVEEPLRELCRNRPLSEIKRLTWKDGNEIVTNPDGPGWKIWIHENLPQIQEIQIEDDKFTCDRERVLELCDALRGKGITWSCCSRHDLPGDVLAKVKEAGVRSLVVGFE
jgi:radical SAM superfamily enzyme YgiQ (UPF0313 family)